MSKKMSKARGLKEWNDKVRGQADRLATITVILENVNNRCAAADGLVTPTRHEITDEELRRIYVLASGE